MRSSETIQTDCHLSRRLPKELQKTSEVGGYQKLFTRVSHISNAQVCILSAELGEVYPSYSNSEKDREASEGCSWWLRSEEAVRQDDRYLWSWESVGGCLREQSTARRCFLKKEVHVFLMHTTEYSTPFDEKWKARCGSGGVSMTLRSLDTPSLPGLCVACISAPS